MKARCLFVCPVWYIHTISCPYSSSFTDHNLNSKSDTTPSPSTQSYLMTLARILGPARQNISSDLLCQHVHSRLGVSRRRERYRAHIHNSQPLYPKYPRLTIHHSIHVALLSHCARSPGVVERHADVADVGQYIGISLDGRARDDFRPKRDIGDAVPGLPHALEGCNCDLAVGGSGIA